jgi:hypothetical protein
VLIQAFVEGELGHFLNAQAKAVDVGGRKAMRITAGAIRRKVAGNVRRAFGGRTTLAKLVRSRITGRGADLEATVYSRAAYGQGAQRPGGSVDLVQLFGQGVTIRSARGGYLAIPTDAAPLKSARGPRGQRMSPREMIEAGHKLAFLPAGAGRLVAVLKRKGSRPVVTHVLVRQVSLRQRYDIQSVVDRYVQQFPEIVAREINAAAEGSAVLRRYGG